MPRKHALIVGGTSGAGRVTAHLLRAEGYAVSVIARRLPRGARHRCGNPRYWAVDVCDAASTCRTVGEILKTTGAPSAVLFFQRHRGPGDAWTGEIETSLTATKRILELLVERFHLKQASVVLVSSINAHLISTHLSVGYHVAKAGLNQMARYYAATLASRGIRVNSVSPITFLKPESQAFFLKQKRVGALYRKMIPLGRMCTAGEVAQAAAFLCNPKASFITGQDLVLDGGLGLLYQEALVRKIARI